MATKSAFLGKDDFKNERDVNWDDVENLEVTSARGEQLAAKRKIKSVEINFGENNKPCFIYHAAIWEVKHLEEGNTRPLRDGEPLYLVGKKYAKLRDLMERKIKSFNG